ncbi:MAG: metallophosphoesterase [Deltaproteobacteria bacterium]|nr:metallophosphoesterase [Deltaproteobacteria bacterium]
MRSLSAFLLFLAVFLSLYGLLHFYFYWKVAHAFVITPLWKVMLGFLLLLLLLAPILVHLSAHAGMDAGSKAIAYIGYLWMGSLFLFVSIHVAVDMADGLLYLASKFLATGLSKARPTALFGFVATCIAVMGVMLYGVMDAGRIRTEIITIETEKLPRRLPSLRVVQISDVHLSAISGRELAEKIAECITRLKPDLLLSTGDLVDRGLIDPGRTADLFRALDAPYGKYAVTGNHEFYAGLKEALSFTRDAGFRVLRNEAVTVAGAINLVGVDDPTARRYGMTAFPLEEDILKSIPGENLTLLLKHQPRVNKKSLGKFDLQLSGHTHGGQIFPFKLIVMLAFPYHQGFYELPGKSSLYVSRGTGTWGPPMRFLSPPEVTLIEFQRKTGVQR